MEMLTLGGDDVLNKDGSMSFKHSPQNVFVSADYDITHNLIRITHKREISVLGKKVDVGEAMNAIWNSRWSLPYRAQAREEKSSVQLRLACAKKDKLENLRGEF